MRTMYVATMDIGTRHAVADLEEALAPLADFDPVVITSDRGWLRLQVRVSATSLAHACVKSAAMARAATGEEAIACEVMTQREYAARHGIDEESAFGGRHAAESGSGPPTLPRQATDTLAGRPGRHKRFGEDWRREA